MVVLAIDTCTRRSSVALRDDAVLRAECSWETERHHTAGVSARIRDLMRTASIQSPDIGAVAVAIGPGSFTGVRCGLAIAKGFAVAMGVPLIGVSAFEVIASAQPDMGVPIVALVEIGRKRVAAQYYLSGIDGLSATGEWRIQTIQELAGAVDAPAWICGDMAPALAALLEQQPARAGVRCAPAPLNLRRAGILAEIGYRRWQNGQVDDPALLMPIYPAEAL